MNAFEERGNFLLKRSRTRRLFAAPGKLCRFFCECSDLREEFEIRLKCSRMISGKAVQLEQVTQPERRASKNLARFVQRAQRKWISPAFVRMAQRGEFVVTRENH